MAIAFNRRYALTLVKPAVDTFFGPLPNGTLITGLEIRFKVERSLEPTPNTAFVEVLNLSESSRATLQQKPLRCRLEVGYQRDARLATLFDGDMTFAASKRDDGNVVTKLTVGDGARSFTEARVSTSLTKGVDVRTAVKEIAKSMGLAIPTNIEGVKNLGKQFATGLTLRGPSRDLMTRILGDTGVGWSIQDGQLQLLGETDTRAGLIELISPTNGMIGSPDYGAPKDPFKPAILKVRRLLRPQIFPGTRVKIKSAEIDGVFRVAKVVHTGDFRDNDWYTDLECNPL